MPNRSCKVSLICAAVFGLATASATAGNEMRDALWAAVRAGDPEAVRVALNRGAEVNAKNEMGVSALWIAAGKGKLDVIEASGRTRRRTSMPAMASGIRRR